jgi:hypothetical protein
LGWPRSTEFVADVEPLREVAVNQLLHVDQERFR